MKRIYVNAQFQQLTTDVVKRTITPQLVVVDIEETTENHYDPWLTNFSQEDIDNLIFLDNKKRIDELWEACNKYRKEHIDTLGVVKLNAKTAPNTKAQAIITWVEELWTLYYTKRNAITSIEPYSPTFDEHGDLPYSYIDAIEE